MNQNYFEECQYLFFKKNWEDNVLWYFLGNPSLVEYGFRFLYPEEEKKKMDMQGFIIKKIISYKIKIRTFNLYNFFQQEISNFLQKKPLNFQEVPLVPAAFSTVIISLESSQDLYPNLSCFYHFFMVFLSTSILTGI